MGDPFAASVDFDRSHLLFPTLVIWLLALLGLAILATRWRAIAGGLRGGGLGIADPMRFGGTLGLIVVYFLALPAVGRMFPNTGLGFLICSVPFVMALAVLFMDLRTRPTLIIAAATAILAPFGVWLVMARAFNISLP